MVPGGSQASYSSAVSRRRNAAEKKRGGRLGQKHCQSTSKLKNELNQDLPQKSEEFKNF